MDVFRDFDVSVFHRLNPFFRARNELRRFELLVVELGDIICAYGLQEHVGINLLHKHFEISDDELVVRRFRDNVANMQPEKAENAKNTIPYLWAISIGKSGKGLYPLEFVDLPEEYRNRAIEEISTIQQNTRFLAELTSKLEELNLAEVFGLALAHSRLPFVIEEGRTLLETTDEENRILTLAPTLQSLVKEQPDSTQTLWVFTPKRQAFQGLLGAECVSHCISHCHGHCGKHGGESITFAQGGRA